mgnify:CR=1 FL=1
MKQLKFEWYVLNERFNRNHVIEPYNIFNNIHVNEETNKLCIKYKRDKMSFENFADELRKIIAWQEYEIVVGSLFAHEEKDLKKIDCYQQALPNIKIIAKYVLEEYYPKLKISLNTQDLA